MFVFLMVLLIVMFAALSSGVAIGLLVNFHSVGQEEETGNSNLISAKVKQ